jgi:hypothetical protein
LEANHTQPGSTRAEAERRRFVLRSSSQVVDKQLTWFFRAMALKALDQRLANPANAPSSTPSARPHPPASSSNPEGTKITDEHEAGDLGITGKANR